MKFVVKVIAGTLIVIVVLIVLIAACASAVSKSDDDPAKVDAAPTTATAPEPTTTEEDSAPEPSPSGDFKSNCDLLLNPDFDSGPVGWFVADAEITNTGNIGTVNRVTAAFKQAGSKPIRLVKKVRVRYNDSKSVHFKIPATQAKADAFQAAPGYFDGSACSVHVAMVDTFGAAH